MFYQGGVHFKMPSVNEKNVAALWEHFGCQNWDAAADLLDPDFVARWPQSQIQFDDPVNFISMNRAYPGTHKIKLLSMKSAGDTVISEVEIKSIMPDGQRLHLFAISFFEFKKGKIIRATEYWADMYDAPTWQLQYAS